MSGLLVSFRVPSHRKNNLDLTSALIALIVRHRTDFPWNTPVSLALERASHVRFSPILLGNIVSTAIDTIFVFHNLVWLPGLCSWGPFEQHHSARQDHHHHNTKAVLARCAIGRQIAKGPNPMRPILNRHVLPVPRPPNRCSSPFFPTESGNIMAPLAGLYLHINAAYQIFWRLCSRLQRWWCIELSPPGCPACSYSEADSSANLARQHRPTAVLRGAAVLMKEGAFFGKFVAMPCRNEKVIVEPFDIWDHGKLRKDRKAENKHILL